MILWGLPLLNMNNTGSANPSPENDALDDNIRVPVRLLIIGLVLVVLALIIGSQVIGVLYAIVFPPSPPVPQNVSLLSHTTSDYGVDDWLYTSSDHVCDVVKYYQSQGALCRIAPLWCGDNRSADTTISGVGMLNQNVARCVEEGTFSIFAFRWEVVIATGSTTQESSQFRVNREIYWTGAVPPQGQNVPGDFPTEIQ